MKRKYIQQIFFGLFMKRMLLVVTKHFKYQVLTFDVVNKRLGDCNGELQQKREKNNMISLIKSMLIKLI